MINYLGSFLCVSFNENYGDVRNAYLEYYKKAEGGD